VQGDLFTGFEEVKWEVVEVRTDPEQFYLDADGIRHEFVVYCLTQPIGWNRGIDSNPTL
jgi:hypothetical protein